MTKQNPFLIHKISEELIAMPEILKGLSNSDKQGVAEAKAINILKMAETLNDLDEGKRAIRADIFENFDEPDSSNIMAIINKYL